MTGNKKWKYRDHTRTSLFYLTFIIIHSPVVSLFSRLLPRNCPGSKASHYFELYHTFCSCSTPHSLYSASSPPLFLLLGPISSDILPFTTFAIDCNARVTPSCLTWIIHLARDPSTLRNRRTMHSSDQQAINMRNATAVIRYHTPVQRAPTQNKTLHTRTNHRRHKMSFKRRPGACHLLPRRWG